MSQLFLWFIRTAASTSSTSILYIIVTSTNAYECIKTTRLPLITKYHDDNFLRIHNFATTTSMDVLLKMDGNTQYYKCRYTSLWSCNDDDDGWIWFAYCAKNYCGTRFDIKIVYVFLNPMFSIYWFICKLQYNIIDQSKRFKMWFKSFGKKWTGFGDSRDCIICCGLAK